MRCRKQATNEKGVEVVDTSIDTLELHVLFTCRAVSQCVVSWSLFALGPNEVDRAPMRMAVER